MCMMNFVIAKHTDAVVTEGERYKITCMHDGMLHIDVHGKNVCIDAEDTDFTVYLNDTRDMTEAEQDIYKDIIAKDAVKTGRKL